MSEGEIRIVDAKSMETKELVRFNKKKESIEYNSSKSTMIIK